MVAEKINIVILGSGGVGKSSITVGFINNEFLDEYDPTIEDSYSKNIIVGGKEYQLDITDTAGQEEYRGLWSDKLLREGDGFILVYDITLKSSFDELEEIHNKILRARDDNIHCPTIIVGNKCDLIDLREVSDQDAVELSKKIRSLRIEASAKLDLNVHDTFISLVQYILKLRSIQEKPIEVDGEGEESTKGCCVIL